MSRPTLRDELERAVNYGENHSDARVIREVLYALDREYGAESISAEYRSLQTHDSAFAGVDE